MPLGWPPGKNAMRIPSGNDLSLSRRQANAYDGTPVSSPTVKLQMRASYSFLERAPTPLPPSPAYYLMIESVRKSSYFLGDPHPDPRFLASLGALSLVYQEHTPSYAFV
jgi:hypothetical protein